MVRMIIYSYTVINVSSIIVLPLHHSRGGPTVEVIWYK